MFDKMWERSTSFEVVYREETEDDDEEEITQIVQSSEKQFADLIRYFAKHPEKMREMPPRKFEEFIADLFAKEGHKVELTKVTRDGGRDILVFPESSLGRHLHLIECKRYADSKPINVSLVRSLYGVVEQERATAGMLVTTTHFTPPAIQFIDSLKNRLAKKDYDDVVKWIKKHAES
jgi:restriction system protein